MDLLPPEEFATHLQKYTARVVLRGESVKGEKGRKAVFIEQSASASQITAAKVLDTISRFPAMAGKANEAVSADTHKNEGCLQTAKASGNGTSCSMDIVPSLSSSS